MVNELSAKIRSCGHTVTCRDCTEKLMKQGDPCPFCRKAIVGFELGKWSSVTGAAGLCPASLKNLSELASGDGFNEYFHDKFNGNEASYKRWKGVFDVLVIQEGKGGDGPIETRVLRITNSEDLVKLRALAKLCSKEYFDDASLSVVAWRRIMEVWRQRRRWEERRARMRRWIRRSSRFWTLLWLWGGRVVLLEILRMRGDIISERRRGTRSS